MMLRHTEPACRDEHVATCVGRFVRRGWQSEAQWMTLRDTTLQRTTDVCWVTLPSAAHMHVFPGRVILDVAHGSVSVSVQSQGRFIYQQHSHYISAVRTL